MQQMERCPVSQGLHLSNGNAAVPASQQPGAPSNWKEDDRDSPRNTAHSELHRGNLSPLASATASMRPRLDEEAELADRLRLIQQRQQARFAALPQPMKEDYHILTWHQYRLRANQAAHDAALALLRRPWCHPFRPPETPAHLADQGLSLVGPPFFEMPS